MLRHKFLLLLAAVPLTGIQSLWAASAAPMTVQVGTCIPNLQSYSTISDAVSGVTPNSIVQVCPGTYAEQVTITQPLTLVGYNTGTANQVLITVPPGGLLSNATSMFGEPVAAQILVLGAGHVDIQNIAVDGTGGDMGCLSWLAGIFYGSGSSGDISQVRASGQIDGTCGVGIWAENANNPKLSVTIEDSSVFNVDSTGIFAGSGDSSTLSVALRNNVVNAGAAVAGIDTASANGVLIGNVIIGGSPFGLFDLSGSDMESNTVTASSFGIFMGNGGTASDNYVWGANLGVLLGASGAVLNGNRVMSSTGAGVELGCFAATVKDNLVNDAPIGMDSATTALDTNTFANTAIPVVNGCAVAAPRVNPKGWHTPATPHGSRKK